MNYQDYIGKEYPPFTFDVTAADIAAFAEAIGEDDAVHRDEEAAKNAGLPAITAPLTFPFTIVMTATMSFKVVQDLGIEPARTIHAEQSFETHRAVVAGDRIEGRNRIVDIYEKKAGALMFIVTECALTDHNKEPVCDLRSVMVIRNG